MANAFLLALDAGHGRYTAGKRCLKSLDPNETREWILNDRVSRYIMDRAAMYQGFEVLRVDDVTGETDVSHRERCRIANEAGADLYLSSHHNAGINGGSGGGVVAFCSEGSQVSPAWRDALYEAVVAAGGLRGNRTQPLQKKNYNVLVYSDMAAVLIEYGFMDSSTDVPVILSEEYAKTVGYAVADAIAAQADLERINEAGGLYNTLEEVPDWAKPTISKLVEDGTLQGTGEGLALTMDMIRILVVLDRRGVL